MGGFLIQSCFDDRYLCEHDNRIMDVFGLLVLNMAMRKFLIRNTDNASFILIPPTAYLMCSDADANSLFLTRSIMVLSHS